MRKIIDTINSDTYLDITKYLLARSAYEKQINNLPYKFIVVNRKNCKPMVWDFPMTEASGQLEIITPSGYHIIWRDPYDIGKELRRYLDENLEYPIGTKESQDIVNWLRTN